MFEKLLKAPTENNLIQFFRYAITASIAFIADVYTLLALTEVLKINYLFAVPVAYLTGILVNYVLSSSWVFNKKNEETSISDELTDLITFAIIGIIGLFIVEFLMFFITERCHVYYIYSKLISNSVAAFWNFYGRKKIIYKNATNIGVE